MLHCLMFWLFVHAPNWLLHYGLSAAAFCRSVVRLFWHFEIDVCLYRGLCRSYVTTVLWVGVGDQREYLLQLLYDGKHDVIRLRPTNVFGLRRRIAAFAGQCDMVCVERSSLLRPLKGYARIAPILNTRMPVSALADPGSAHSTKSRRKLFHRRLSLVARSNVTYREFSVARHPEQLRLFYDELYAPHIGSTYGRGSVESFETMKLFYAKGVLRLAYLDGQAISGALFLQSKDVLVFCKYGVRDPEDKVHRASSGVHSHIKYAEEKQVRSYIAFHVVPFFNDGVFHYKRSCGLGVERETRTYYRDTDLYLRIIQYHRGVVAFLKESPFIYLRHGHLVACLCCHDDLAPLEDDIVRQYGMYVTVGVDQYEFHVNRELTDEEKARVLRRCGCVAGDGRLTFVAYREPKVVADEVNDDEGPRGPVSMN